MKERPNKKNKQLTEEDFDYGSWFSLIDALLKPEVSVAALATYINNEGVKTFDAHGKLINATDGKEKESTSKACALNLLSLYYVELRDCADLPRGQHPPEDPDRWLEHESPLCKFGWPKDEIPDDTGVFAMCITNSLPAGKKLSSSTENANSHDWKEQARGIADECYDSDTRNKSRDSLRGYASRVMDIMRKREIYAPHGPINNPNTVMRDALQADQWWRKKKQITYGKRGISGKHIK